VKFLYRFWSNSCEGLRIYPPTLARDRAPSAARRPCIRSVEHPKAPFASYESPAPGGAGREKSVRTREEGKWAPAKEHPAPLGAMGARPLRWRLIFQSAKRGDDYDPDAMDLRPSKSCGNPGRVLTAARLGL